LGGLDRAYARAGSRAGGAERGEGMLGGWVLEKVLLVVLLDLGLLVIARATAERVELLRKPGERWIR